MNCVKGDIARIVAASSSDATTTDLFCDVLDVAPIGYFNFPDGTPAFCGQSASWVIRPFRKIRVELDSGGYRVVDYAVCADAYLRPIRDQPGEDQTLAWLPVPVPGVVETV
ncbi:MAG: hypothetical protein V4772_08905 [Pseudomonadota bacterium]